MAPFRESESARYRGAICRGQQEHHRNRTFQEEIRELLRGTALISMSDTFGIEKPRSIETRIQRLVIFGVFGFLGRCPG